MTSPLVITQLDALESQATQHLEAFKKSYWNFCDVLAAIRDSGAWKGEYRTWDDYLSQRWLPELPFTSSARIRQLEAAYPTAKMILEVTGVTNLNENNVATLKKIVPEIDRYLLPEIVSRVHAESKRPAARHYQAVYELLKERELIKVVSVGGESLPTDIVTIAVQEAIREADMRQNQHITDNSKWSTIARYEVNNDSPIRVTGVEISEGQKIIVIVREPRGDSS